MMGRRRLRTKSPHVIAVPSQKDLAIVARISSGLTGPVYPLLPIMVMLQSSQTEATATGINEEPVFIIVRKRLS
jgi:hypothetical protein